MARADPHDPVGALAEAKRQLLARRNAAGHWEGRLSGSALATATAVCALAMVDPRAHRERVRRGLAWLAHHQNDDGGWGDTPLSHSNIATTLLAWSALGAAGGGEEHARATAAAERWLERRAATLDPELLVQALAERYGADRSFSAPILMTCILCGRLGPLPGAWRYLRPLPFELAALPHAALKWLRLPVVSYAMAALIAVGQARYHHRPPLCPVTRVVRGLLRDRTLRKLTAIQPASGGYLEAVPLTAFVVIALAAMGRGDHPAAARGAAFLANSMREDGSWPIETNLATWVTTLAVNALAAGGGLSASLAPDDRRNLRRWLLAQQHRRTHPYTQAAPGGWAWTDLPGGVPDADDTPGAMLALHHLGAAGRARQAAIDAARWLLGVQNRDGGIPTFCRGWGRLAFDRSCPDLTAHALRAWKGWRGDLPGRLRRRVTKAAAAAIGYLRRSQRGDGAWMPLWFGNQGAANEANPTYGTARVLTGLAEFTDEPQASEMIDRGAAWLVSAQAPGGGWGGERDAPVSIEETAVAVEALAALSAGGPEGAGHEHTREARSAVQRGVGWLVEHTDRGRAFAPSPIGLYFARLWYYEEFYPLIFTVAALQRAAGLSVAPRAR
jgi:squalene-hopene/tetraprenyl-beta-curcumene cyclase